MEERIFCWSFDGFGSKLFRVTDNGKERFVNRYSSMDIDENHQEVRRNGEFDYPSFEEFWKEYTDQPLWLHNHPIFVHKEYKPYLRDYFEDIPQGSLTMGEICRLSLWLHKID